jgi:hypothetical protein
MKKIFVLVLVLMTLAGFSQQRAERPDKGLSFSWIVPDSVYVPYVVQDKKIDWLLNAYTQKVLNQRGFAGYRVQIYMDSGNQARLKTQRSRAAFEEEYPGVSAYIVYEEPNFKLRVGDFRTRLDARRFLEKIKNSYPGAYIVLDVIQFPPLD